MLVGVWDRLAAGEEMTYGRYEALHQVDKKLPSPSTFQKYGRSGFGPYRDQARELRFAALAAA